MSWIEKIEDNLTITTGEGSTFEVVWRNASKQLSYNTSTFEFSGLAGSLVRRKLPKGTQYSIEMYFRGPDHLDEADDFATAAADPRPWTLAHPFYGRLLVQPVQLVFDDSALSVTKVTGTVLETIEEGTQATANLSDQIEADATELSETTAENVTELDAGSRNALEEQNGKTFENYKKSVERSEDLELLNTALADAQSAVQGGIQKPVQAMRTAQNLVNLPFRFSNSVEARFDMLSREFDNLVASVAGATGTSRKQTFEAAGANAVASQATVATKGDYANRAAVLITTSRLIANYDTYLTTLDALQGDGYFPQRINVARLEQIATTTITLLFQIAQNAKQERIFYLEQDSNAILLAHRFYGPSEVDANLDRFIEDNEIGLSEVLEIKKGRAVKYYV